MSKIMECIKQEDTEKKKLVKDFLKLLIVDRNKHKYNCYRNTISSQETQEDTTSIIRRY